MVKETVWDHRNPFLKTTPNQPISADGILDKDSFYNSSPFGRTPAPHPWLSPDEHF
jgi:hypothetical protein